MNQFEVVQIIALVGWLILAVSAGIVVLIFARLTRMKWT